MPDARPPPKFWSEQVTTVPEPRNSRQRARIAAVRPQPFLAFQQPLYERFVNMIMMDGKKQTARKILWNAFAQLRSKGHNPTAVFEGALENVLPMMEIRTSKHGQGQVPFPLAPKRAEGIAMKWLVQAARKRGASTNMDQRLANELLQAYQNKGTAVGRRETVHKTALANQASAHFRWRGSAVPPGSVDLEPKKVYRPVARRSMQRFQGAFSKRR